MSTSKHSSRLRVLFVCALNQWRSPTAEQLYKDDARLEVRSAGLRPEAPRRVAERDLKWADVVFVMEQHQKGWIIERFRHLELPLIQVLHVSMNLRFMDPRLQAALRQAINPALAELLAGEA